MHSSLREIAYFEKLKRFSWSAYKIYDKVVVILISVFHNASYFNLRKELEFNKHRNLTFEAINVRSV